MNKLPDWLLKKELTFFDLKKYINKETIDILENIPLQNYLMTAYIHLRDEERVIALNSITCGDIRQHAKDETNNKHVKDYDTIRRKMDLIEKLIEDFQKKL